MTNKPATPLPDSAPLPWRVQHGGSQEDIIHAEDARVVSLHFDRSIPAQEDAANERAAYIAHAANAYPRLVQALQDVMRDQLKTVNLQGMLPGPRQRIEKARTLLAELGE